MIHDLNLTHDSSIHYLAGEPVVGGEGAHAVGDDHDGRVSVGLVRRLGEGGEIGKEWIEFIWKGSEFTDAQNLENAECAIGSVPRLC